MKWNVIGIITALLFILIAFSYDTEAAKAIDNWAAKSFGGNEFLEAFHYIGNTGVILTITVLFGLLLIIVKKALYSALFTLLVVKLGFELNQQLKVVFERPRPDVVDQLTSYSFPSGHAMTTTICLLTIVFVVHQIFLKGKMNYWLYGGAVVLSILVALSRVAGHRHFFTDIVAGLSLGVTFVVVSAIIYKKFMR